MGFERAGCAAVSAANLVPNDSGQQAAMERALHGTTAAIKPEALIVRAGACIGWFAMRAKIGVFLRGINDL